MADESAKEKFFNKEGTDWWVWWVSAGFIIVFIVAALINVDAVGAIVTASCAWVCDYFGAFWQILLIATFFLGLGLAIGKYGAIKLTD
ncbi:MAG: BCCT family transporter, partial [Syntrophaceticus sp.]|nr:BCCT family transporter [Syntrophaceticus sp.]